MDPKRPSGKSRPEQQVARSRQVAAAASLLTVLFGVAGCSEPSLQVPRPGGVAVELRPLPVADRAPRLIRARVDGAQLSAEPWLFRDQVSSYQERALRSGEVAATLRERAVPLRYWRDAGSLWVQPLQLLEPGADYQLALTGDGVVESFKAAEGESPAVQRLFPPSGGTAGRFSILCGLPAALPLPDITLEPGHVPVVVSSGVLGTERPGCVTLEVAASLDTAAVAPPELNGVTSDPSLFEPEEGPSPSPPACTTGVAIDHSCLEVLDDRLLVSASTDSLWLLREPEVRTVLAPAGVRALLAQGLAPGAEVTLVAQLLERYGSPREVRLPLAMDAPRRHLVLNEVLANPRGAEPASEWIEIINDAEVGTTLAGVWLEDGGGSVALPPEPIGAHEIVLLSTRLQPASGPDVPVSEAVRVIALPTLGVRGLSNSGEALLLVAKEGVISRFPVIAAKEAGRSLARRHPGSADDSAADFAPHGAPGASPGLPNYFDD